MVKKGENVRWDGGKKGPKEGEREVGERGIRERKVRKSAEKCKMERRFFQWYNMRKG